MAEEGDFKLHCGDKVPAQIFLFVAWLFELGFRITDRRK